MLPETRVSLGGNLTETYKKQWYDSAENAATETRDYRHVSATVLCVYAKFPFTDS